MTYRLCHHASQQATRKGVSAEKILLAANQPSVTYDNRRHPGQRRHIRDGIVAVVDPTTGLVITHYVDVEKTPLRPDQRDRDARRYGRQLANA